MIAAWLALRGSPCRMTINLIDLFHLLVSPKPADVTGQGGVKIVTRLLEYRWSGSRMGGKSFPDYRAESKIQEGN